MDTATLKLARMRRDRPISQNELYWIDVIRLASRDADPAPTLAITQALRLVFQRGVPDVGWQTAKGEVPSNDWERRQ